MHLDDGIAADDKGIVTVVGDELLVPDRLYRVGTVVDFFSSILAGPSIHCVATLSMPASYFVKLMRVLSSLECLAVVHTGFVVLRRMGKFKDQNLSLIREQGTSFMDFFVSLLEIERSTTRRRRTRIARRSVIVL